MICQGVSGYMCGRDLPEEQFRKKKGAGLSSTCISCREKQAKSGTPGYRRNYMMRRNYGVDTTRYDELFKAQQGVCATCLEPQEPPNFLNIDHCHTSGEVRGLLCWRCNIAAGHLRNSPEVAARMAEYLKR